MRSFVWHTTRLDAAAAGGSLVARSVNDIMISLGAWVVVMTDALIRGLSDEAIERIDAEAAALGLSRNEFLRRKLEGTRPSSPEATVTTADWSRSAAVFGDLTEPEVMDSAWR